MSALAMAMLLTGAGAVDEQRRRPAPVPPPVMMPLPSPPPMIYVAPPVPPPAPPPPPRPPSGTPARRLQPNLNSLFSHDDYPVAAMRADAQGTVGFRLDIGRYGRVARCTVTSSSGSAPLDQATCRILAERARYAPARDARGRRTRGSDSGRVTWRLPAD
ncbi:MAG TPA: energy transducer TonB [Allosphingosinicella sp.]|nr:energy transducer TonB [Allosphingosinicella sp.]